jgi:ankyrin repeat protein
MSGCERGHMEIIQALLNKGANIEATDLEGQTPLMYAVLRNKPKIVSVLLEKKANMEVKDSVSGFNQSNVPS